MNLFFWLMITIKPSFIYVQIIISPPWSLVVRHVDDNFTVKCESEGEKVWKHNDVPITNDRTFSHLLLVKKPLENGLYLKFNKIQREFKGFYNCTTMTITEHGERLSYSKGFDLIVIKPVTFLNTPTNETLVHEVGDDITLACEADGEPPPKITWFFNKEIINDGDIDNIEIHKNYLKIVNAKWNNSGTYICRAFQKYLQTQDTELTYVVKIKHKPTSYTDPLKTIRIYGFQYERKNITCQVYAYPIAYFIWYRNNNPLETRNNEIKIYNDENRSILEISLQNADDIGIYECEAANPLGILIHTMNVQLIKKPRVPKLLIFDLTHNTAIISVHIEPYPIYEFNCSIDCTEYTYCEYDEKWRRGVHIYCKNERIRNTNKTHCKIDQLKPLTKYAVRATIMNKGGSGNYSEQLIFRTKKELPALLLNGSAGIGINSHTMILYIVLYILQLNNE